MNLSYILNQIASQGHSPSNGVGDWWAGWKMAASTAYKRFVIPKSLNPQPKSTGSSLERASDPQMY